MKRFLLFCYDTYYPVGGWGDFIGAFDSVEEAESAIDKTFHYWQIVDMEKLEVVKSG